MKKWPDFFLIGAMKSGSTTLHECLGRHPGIFMSSPKEPGFFSRDDRFSRGRAWYQEHFAGALDTQLWGDSSTCYSRRHVYPETASRIYKVNPNAKFIYIVRDPVLRAYSHYKHRMSESIMCGRSVITFKDFLTIDKEVLKTGAYYYQIRPFFDVFGAENVYVCRFDDAIKQNREKLLEIFTFLGVNPESGCRIDVKKNNEAGTSLNNFYVRKSIDALRKSPFMIQIVRFMPKFIKRSAFLVLKSALMRSSSINRKVKNDQSSLSFLDQNEHEFLADYYRNDLIKFSELTGLDVSDWNSFKV